MAWIRKQKRHLIQLLAAVLTNCNFSGFFTGKIYTGPTKQVCVPGLNCYSCPGAVGACPMGAMQAVAGGRKQSFSFYVLGTLLLFGVVLGRLICGFLCPFGFFQDLLHKIKTPKVNVPKKADRILRWGKYLFLLLPVLLLPAVLVDEFGTASPYFCKWICPVGTLEGGIPLMLTNAGLRQMAGFLFRWKFAILMAVLAAAVLIYRPFCKYICPLGAFYALLNRFSFYRMQVDAEKCTRCGRCAQTCKMGVDPLKNINSPECIRCGECKDACNFGAISSGFRFKPEERK